MKGVRAYLTEVFQISFITRLLQPRPCHLRQLIGNVVQVKLAVLFAFQSLVACYLLALFG